ncbi:MAG: histidinol-phosphate aminotransferase family protein [Phycisphaerales bacterium]|nr:MAG: histidinol-phosphate aminotransferase family protein [Phycisphaerales bacterium]
MSTVRSIPITPASRMHGVAAYRPPVHPPAIDLYLDANEVPDAPIDDLRESFARVPDDAIRRYPDASRLERLIAERFGLDPSSVLVTGGADDGIDRLMRAVLEPGRRLAAFTPSFEMIPRGAKLAGAEVDLTPWLEGPAPIDALLGGLSEATGAIAAVSPNNPTGLTLTMADWDRLSGAAASRGALLIADLAYAEFADEDPTRELASRPNVVVLKTLSKAWGMAGLRVGLMLGDPGVIGLARAAGNPYACSALSIALAQSRLQRGEDAIKETLASVRSFRTTLTDRLRSRGVSVTPSQANFVLARFEDPARVQSELASRGIAVRAFPGREHLKDALRITCPTQPANQQRLLDSIDGALATGMQR